MSIFNRFSKTEENGILDNFCFKRFFQNFLQNGEIRKESVKFSKLEELLKLVTMRENVFYFIPPIRNLETRCLLEKSNVLLMYKIRGFLARFARRGKVIKI